MLYNILYVCMYVCFFFFFFSFVFVYFIMYDEFTGDREVDEFAQSVINWLSKFEGCPFFSGSFPSILMDPQMIYRLLQVLLYKEDFAMDDSWNMLNINRMFLSNYEITQNANSIVISQELLRQIAYLDQIIHSHVRHFSTKNVKVKAYYQEDIPNLFQLILVKKPQELIKLCRFLLKICSHVHKQSTNLAIEQLEGKERGLIEYHLAEIQLKFQPTKQEDEPVVSQYDDLIYDEVSSDSLETDLDIRSIVWENRVYEGVIRKLVRN